MELSDILNKTVSYQGSVTSELSKEPTISEILEEIRGARHKEKTARLRRILSNGDIDTYKSEKKRLPAVTFCATFLEKRRKENLKKYNQVIVIDIDNLDSNRLTEVKAHLISDEYVIAFWESPSQNGIKGLVHVIAQNINETPGVDEFHSFAFQSLVKYFFERYGINLDKSGSDTTRLCFLSHDKDLHLKASCLPFVVDVGDVSTSRVRKPATSRKEISPPLRRLLCDPDGKNHPANRDSIQAIIRFLNKKNLSITNAYDQWWRVAYAIADTFTYDIGEKYFLKLSKRDPEKFHESESKDMLLNAYKNSNGSITFQTIVYFAEQIGYKSSNQRASTKGV